MISKWCFVLFLVSAHIIALDADIFGTLCSFGAAITVNTKPCEDNFVEEMNQYLKVYDGSGDLPAFVMCCRINKLESCIATQIEKTCGKGSADLLRGLVKNVLTATKFASNGEVDCVDRPEYKAESPLCWGLPLQIGAGAFLLILLLSCCGCCACRGRRKGSVYGRSGTPTTLVMIPTPQAQYQPAGARQAPYQPINNKSAV